MLVGCLQTCSVLSDAFTGCESHIGMCVVGCEFTNHAKSRNCVAADSQCMFKGSDDWLGSSERMAKWVGLHIENIILCLQLVTQ